MFKTKGEDEIERSCNFILWNLTNKIRSISILLTLNRKKQKSGALKREREKFLGDFKRSNR